MWYDSKIICTTQKAEFCQIRSNDEQIRLGRAKAFAVRPVLNQACPFDTLAPCFNPITSIWILYSHLHFCLWSSQSFAFKELWLKSVTYLASPMGAIHITLIWFVWIWLRLSVYYLLVRWLPVMVGIYFFFGRSNPWYGAAKTQSETEVCSFWNDIRKTPLQHASSWERILNKWSQ